MIHPLKLIAGLERTALNVRDKYKELGEENSDQRTKGIKSIHRISDGIRRVVDPRHRKVYPAC